MMFGLCNVITALYVENTVAAAKYNSLHQKRQRLLDAQMFADRTKELVEFVWRIAGSERESQTSSGRGSISTADVDMLHSIQITPDWFNHLRSFKEFQEL